MRYEEKHLSGNLIKDSKFRKEILDYANLLNPIMKKILDNELRLGNKISCASSNYPDQGSLNVTLAERFKGKYKFKNVDYTKINDPHYWFEDYTSAADPRHMILH